MKKGNRYLSGSQPVSLIASMCQNVIPLPQVKKYIYEKNIFMYQYQYPTNLSLWSQFLPTPTSQTSNLLEWGVGRGGKGTIYVMNHLVELAFKSFPSILHCLDRAAM